jgi:PAS domain S-box-containing protein
MIGLVTTVQIQRMKADFTRVLFAQQSALISRTAEELDDKLGMLRDLLALTAQKIPPESVSTAEGLQEEIARHALLALFDDVLIVDTHGIIVADEPRSPGRIGVNSSDREFFKTVMRTRAPLIAEPVFGRTSGKPIVQMVAPVLDRQGKVVAVLVGVLRLYKDNVLGHLRNAKVGRSGYYFAVTRGDVPVYVLHPDPAQVLRPRPANASATGRVHDGFEGTSISVNSSGVTALNTYKKLRTVPWTLAASLPAEEAFEPFDGSLYRLAAWSAFASLLAAGLIGWLTVRLLSPLIGLRDALLALRSGASEFKPIPVLKQDEIGELTEAFNSLMDERLAADARVASLIEFAPYGVMVLDAQGHIDTFNRQAEQFFGYGRAEVIGMPLEMLTPERFRRDTAGTRIGSLASSTVTDMRVLGTNLDLWGLRKDGSEFPIELSLSAVKSRQGASMLAMVSDMSERYRLQQEVQARAVELEEERDRAQAANRAKSDFVANMSHEIRTPLNGVLGMVYLLGNTALTAEQRKYLTMIRVAGQSLLGILNDVLDFSKIEARRMEISPVDFDLDEVMNTLATTMTMNAGDKELELAIEVAPDVPRRLHGDELRLQQILVNLAGNAVKFTESGEVVVSIKLVHIDQGKALLHFTVRDTGIGMTEIQQAQLFNAFSQGDESITRRFGGTGLGLAITKHLVNLMGGEIALRSAEGKGSTFWFELPFDVLAPPVPERRLPAMGKLRLLVADDNQTSRELIGKLIRAWGWHADEVDSGAAALAMYRRAQGERQHYDVVLADWHMPRMDGLATAKAIREAAAGEQQPIVVMVNAFARDRLEEISSSAEADVVLMKPITGSNLFDALHQALVTKKSGDEAVMQDEDMAGSLRGAHFLLVEDNLLNQAVARGILEHAGATLEVAGDGQQAVEMLRSAPRRYDIVLMDMQMPILDGFSATRIVRNELRMTLPVIAMTAGVLASERERCVKAGISDFIAKPVVVEEMMEVIKRHLPVIQAPQSAPAQPPHERMVSAEPDGRAAGSGEPPAISTALPDTDDTIFSMEKLMRVMGRDAKGRDVLLRIVKDAIANGLEPVRQAEIAMREERYDDAARIFHGLRGSVGVMGTKRLISAAHAFEHAVAQHRQALGDERQQRAAELPALLARVGAELELALQHARAWLTDMENNSGR